MILIYSNTVIFTSLAKEVMFSVVMVSLSTCLFMCKHHYSKSYEQVPVKFYIRVKSDKRKK